MPGARSRHDTDRAGTRDDDVLAHHRPLQRSVGRVAEGVEHGSEVGVEVGGLDPDVRGGDDDVVGERAVTVDPDALGPDAEVAAAGPAVAAHPADDMAL